MDLSLSHQEFLLMQKYISERCGILIPEEKSYLIEKRLSKLLVQSGSKNFINFYYLLQQKGNEELAQRTIDAITTNETLWFRDRNPWLTLEEVLLPRYIAEIREGRRSRVRIWSAACATGQEPYSTVMCIDRYLHRQGIDDIKPSHFEILATDVSKEAIQTAMSGRYDQICITRGLADIYRERYFSKDGSFWILQEGIRKAVNFRHFNLKDSFVPLGRFDIVFCRYVTIYFYEELKKLVLNKIASALTTEGVLFLGNSEMFTDHWDSFSPQEHKGGIYYRVKEC